MAITTAITDLVASIYELAASLVHSVYTIISSFVLGITHLFLGFFQFVGDIFQGVFDIVGGVGKFVGGNIVILGLLAAGVFAYLRFTAQGRQLQQSQNGTASSIAGGRGTKKMN